MVLVQENRCAFSCPPSELQARRKGESNTPPIPLTRKKTKMASVASASSAKSCELRLSAQRGDLLNLKKLLANGVCVDSRDISGYNALHYAARSQAEGQGLIVNVLVNNGIDIDSKTNEGLTPLHIFCMIPSRESGVAGGVRGVGFAMSSREASRRVILNALLENGASTDMLDKNGAHPLHYAAASGDEYTVVKLLESGASANSSDLFGRKPHHWAVEHKQSARISALLFCACKAEYREAVSKLVHLVCIRTYEYDQRGIPLLTVAIPTSARPFPTSPKQPRYVTGVPPENGSARGGHS